MRRKRALQLPRRGRGSLGIVAGDVVRPATSSSEYNPSVLFTCAEMLHTEGPLLLRCVLQYLFFFCFSRSKHRRVCCERAHRRRSFFIGNCFLLRQRTKNSCQEKTFSDNAYCCCSFFLTLCFYFTFDQTSMWHTALTTSAICAAECI